MKRLLLITSCLFMATPVFAQQTGMQSPAYAECTALANSNPAQALAKADAWLKIDAGIGAQHCRAMALYGLRRFAEAADTLITVHGLISADNITLRSYVTRQASNALMSANKADQALGLLTKQINDISTQRTDNGVAAGVTSELLVERSRVNSNFGKLDDAAKDLDHAVSLTPTNETVLMERAIVFEKLGDIPLAKNDLKSILVINNSNAGARNMLSRLNGGAVVNYNAPATHTPTADYTQSAAPPKTVEAPAAKKPVKRTTRAKQVKKPMKTEVITSPEAAPVDETAVSAAPVTAVLENPTPKPVETKPATAPTSAASPATTTPAASAAPAVAKPVASPVPAASAAPAAAPATTAPAASAVPAAAKPAMPPLPPLPPKH